MPVITARGLSHSYANRIILDDASLTIKRGERVGLVGDNGTGKSTLASILVEALVPDQGDVAKRTGATIAYLAQQNDFGQHENPRDYILTGLSKWNEAHHRYNAISEKLSNDPAPSEALMAKQASAAEDIERLGGWDPMHRVDEIAEHLGVLDIKTPLSKMSGGERRRVALAQVLVAQSDFAILDEPTNHLDIKTILWLEDYLINSYKGALLLITHDRYVLSNVVQRTIELDRGELFSYKGGWEDYLRAKAERFAQAARSDANKRNTLRKELEWLSRSPQARSTKQKARIQRAESLRDSDDKLQKKDAPKLAFKASKTGKIVATLEDIRVELGGRLLIDDFDLIIQNGDRIGIVGPNGGGKTTLLKLLTEELTPVSGSVSLGGRNKIALFDQERSELNPEYTILQSIADNRDVVSVAGLEMNAKSYLARFGFHSDCHAQKIRTLSGGERARVSLASFLLTDANVLLLDEPTNDLDVTTLTALEDLLIETNATVIVVTHDRYFLDKVAQSVLSFEGDGKVERYEGYAQAAESIRKAQQKKPTISKSPATTSPTPKKNSPKEGLTFTEKHEFAGIMKKIEAAESVLASFDTKLADPTLYTARADQVPMTQSKRDEASLALEALLERWEFLESKQNS